MKTQCQVIAKLKSLIQESAADAEGQQLLIAKLDSLLAGEPTVLAGEECLRFAAPAPVSIRIWREELQGLGEFRAKVNVGTRSMPAQKCLAWSRVITRFSEMANAISRIGKYRTV